MIIEDYDVDRLARNEQESVVKLFFAAYGAVELTQRMARQLRLR
jgi:hypothetical protein